MQFIKHRVNQIEELRSLDPQWGVEIDLRSDCGKAGQIILAHDPWQPGCSFEKWLVEFKRCGLKGPLILNTKEDGLEARAMEILCAQKLNNFFFLDTTVPTLIRWTTQMAEGRFAVRVSIHEPPSSVAPFQQKAEWVWVDCFDGVPMPIEAVRKVSHHFKICIVSPELQGQPIATVNRFLEICEYADAICTKDPSVWLPQLKRAA